VLEIASAVACNRWLPITDEIRRPDEDQRQPLSWDFDLGVLVVDPSLHSHVPAGVPA
jgi:hypothetical protein